MSTFSAKPADVVHEWFVWSRGRGFVKSISHLRGSQQKNADRGKGPYKPTLLLGFNYVYIQRKTR